MLQLTAITGPLKGMSWEIGDRPIIIGRLSTCGIVIEDKIVSRRHCEILRSGEDISIVDLGSSNTTLVNGRPVKEQVLHAGDHVAVGPAVFLVNCLASEAGKKNDTDMGSTTVTVSADDVALLRGRPNKDLLSNRPETAYDLALLFSIGREFSTAPRIAELIGSLERALRERFHATCVWTARYHGVEDDLVPYPAPDSGEIEGPPIDLMRRAILEQRTFLVTDERGAIRVAPLLASGVPVGAVGLRTCPADPDAAPADLEFLLTLASQAAPFFLSIEQAEGMKRDLDRFRALAGESSTLIGDSKPVRQVRSLIRQAARSELSILFIGETGTGKELAARMAHDWSRRSGGPFVTVNCAAIPNELFESELFGYEKGAFTGAAEAKTGQIEQAHGGTLFLDEVGDLSPVNQARLLRVIELGTFHRLGAECETKVDVRVVSATNKDIAALAGTGAFRLDLYHRLSGFEVRMPPLREHLSDIVELAEHFLKLRKDRAKRPIVGFAPEAIEYLKSRPWPGNVRELRTAIERSIVLARGELIQAQDLTSAGSLTAVEPATGKPLTLAEVEKRHIEAVLRKCEGNVSATARILQVSRATLYSKMRIYGLMNGS